MRRTAPRACVACDCCSCRSCCCGSGRNGCGDLLREVASRAGVTIEDVWEKVSWRAKLYAQKLTGGMPDFSWNELLQMTRQQGGFGLGDMALHGMSLEGAVHNPHVTPDDLAAGARIFRENCAVCHGGEGTGGHGPALNHSGLKHGDSDLAIYKVVRDGVPDTAMVPVPLDFTERWQVVAYVRCAAAQECAPGGE